MQLFYASSSSSSLYVVAFAAATMFTSSISGVSGHGYMFQPSSRNYYAYVNGKDYGLESGVPSREYCYHCLNTNTGICGTSEQGVNYDDWLDSVGQPMPWITQASYEVGDTITIGMELLSHHLGHMELRGCPVGDDNGRSATQDCFDEHVLEFVEDISYQMPKDENHPERGYFYGGSTFNGQEFSMRFKLPPSLSGEKVLLQYFYYTANSCSPEGYYDYFAVKNTNLPATFWGGINLSTCTSEQFPGSKEFFTGDSPERFVNCAEVTIGGGGGGNDNPTDAPVVAVVTPTDAPVSPPSPTTTDSDENSGIACCSNDYKTCATWCNESKEFCETNAGCVNMKWLTNGSLEDSEDPNERTCAARWEGCGNNNTCCDGTVCRFVSKYFNQCLHPTDIVV